MKLFIVLLAGLATSVQAGQIGSGNVSNEKMCVCEPCGGKMVPCRETEEQYVKEKFDEVKDSAKAGTAVKASENCPPTGCTTGGDSY